LIKSRAVFTTCAPSINPILPFFASFSVTLIVASSLIESPETSKKVRKLERKNFID